MFVFQMQNLCSSDFYSPTHFNGETKTQLWMSEIADSHDIFCNCDTPFAHLLATIFPPGHKDRVLTIEQILKRDFLQKCHSGGDGAESHGLADTGDTKENIPIKEEEEPLPEDEVEQLLSAAAAAEDADTR